MTNKLLYIEEPKLRFGFNQPTEDSRDGLTLFGPYETTQKIIRAGVIGTANGKEAYSSFVSRINRPIYTTSLGRPFYPGFKSVFGIDWPSAPTVSLLIEQCEIDTVLAVLNVKERTHKLVSLFLDRIKKYLSEEETVVDIWYIVIPKTVYTLCRPQSTSGKATYSKGRIEQFRSGQLSLFEEENKDISEYVEMYESDSDFHDQLKARAIAERIQAPLQVMLETTLLFHSKQTDDEYNDEMKAHIAWTHSSSLYYKLGFLPWKLDAVRPGVCYVGLVFKTTQEAGTRKKYACSAAQMFLDSGDGVVFRGNIGPWMSKDEKSFHLDRASAKELLTVAIKSYYEKNGVYPSELFIHGRTSFSDNEWLGFTDAISVSKQTNLVGVTINMADGFRVFKDNIDRKEQYGVLRGLYYPVNDVSGYLWTKGFIPKTETANHMEVAAPLRIEITRGKSNIATVMKDILALTKLNYNACLYGDGLPVTLRFSDNIGSILTAIPAVDWPAKPFKYYI